MSKIELGTTACTANEGSGACTHFATGVYRVTCACNHTGEGPLCFCHARPPAACHACPDHDCRIGIMRISEDHLN